MIECRQLALKDKNWHVLNVDKLTYAGNLESLASVDKHPHYSFAQVDICNRQVIETIFAEFQPDAIMRLAAESHVDRSIDSPGAFLDTNIMGTYTLLEVAKKYWATLTAAKRSSFRFHRIFFIKSWNLNKVRASPLRFPLSISIETYR